MSKPLLLVPIAGFGSRFREKGITTPKQQLHLATGRSSLEESLGSINLNDFDLHFVLRKSQIENEGFLDFLSSMELGDEPFTYSIIEKPTRGSTETCLVALESFSDRELYIFTVDVAFRPTLKVGLFSEDCDGGVLSFKANSSSYSYARIKEDLVIETAEKTVISNDALVGVYYFRSSDKFKRFAEDMIRAELTTNGEYYIAPLYNLMLKQGQSATIEARRVSEMHLFGTPDEKEFFDKFSSRSLKNDYRIGFGSDHSGHKTKEMFKNAIQARGMQTLDFGAYSEEPSDYSKFLSTALSALARGEIDYVFAFCRSGNGVNIYGNSSLNSVAALIYDEWSADMAVRHNAANFFSFPERVWGEKSAEIIQQCVDAILASRFEGGRHQTRMMESLIRRNGV